MKGGTILVFGNAGFMTATMMMGGKIIILGNAGDGIGESMMAGKIFIAGSVGNPGKNTAICKASEQELADIDNLIRKFGGRMPPGKFTKICAAGIKK
jgi:glutamate synthase domain-containing protein 3